MNGDTFFKGIEAIGKVIFAAIVGAFIMALILLGLGLMSDYYHNTKTFAPIMGAILGFLTGGISGGIVGIIRPNSRSALYSAAVISTIFILVMSILESQFLFSLINEKSYWAFYIEVIYLIGSGIAFILSVWIPAKIVSSI